jgi:hypothetical protein
MAAVLIGPHHQNNNSVSNTEVHKFLVFKGLPRREF